MASKLSMLRCSARMRNWTRNISVTSLLLAALSQSVLAGVILEAGGSNFVAIDLHPDDLKKSESWRNSDLFQTPACRYQPKAEQVRRELTSMRDAGQRKLALVLWFAHSESSADCSGFLLNSAGGRFAPQVIANLRTIIHTAGDLGFNEVQIRFAAMGKNWPVQWKDWQQRMFDENWSVISSTITALADIRSPRTVYDLGVELGGLKSPHCTQCKDYVRRTWRNYIHSFPDIHSYGFSIAVGPGRVANMINDLRNAGAPPPEIAIDTYDPKRPGIKMTEEEIRSAGLDLPILVQETLYNDPEMNLAIRQQARDCHARIRAIMQWPLARGTKGQISESKTPGYPYSP